MTAFDDINDAMLTEFGGQVIYINADGFRKKISAWSESATTVDAIGQSNIEGKNRVIMCRSSDVFDIDNECQFILTMISGNATTKVTFNVENSTDIGDGTTMVNLRRAS